MLLAGGKTQSKSNESDEQKSKTSLSSNFVKYGLKRVCCHCSRSENETYEVKYSITRRTDGKTVHRKKKLPLVMSELPKVLCLEHAGVRPYEIAFRRRKTNERYIECVKLMETKNISGKFCV